MDKLTVLKVGGAVTQNKLLLDKFLNNFTKIKGKKILVHGGGRELDVLLSTGEQVTSALLAGALSELGVKAKSYMNWQIPILTEGNHSSSRIKNIYKKNITNYLKLGMGTTLMDAPVVGTNQGIAKIDFLLL